MKPTEVTVAMTKGLSTTTMSTPFLPKNSLAMMQMICSFTPRSRKKSPYVTRGYDVDGKSLVDGFEEVAEEEFPRQEAQGQVGGEQIILVALQQAAGDDDG